MRPQVSYRRKTLPRNWTAYAAGAGKCAAIRAGERFRDRTSHPSAESVCPDHPADGNVRICPMTVPYILFVSVPVDGAGYGRSEENMETGKKMEMEQFAEEIRERLERQGRFEKVSLQDVRKNNGVMHCGLLLNRAGSNLAPMICLEPFFEEYGDGAGMEEIIGKILEVYNGACREGVDMSFFLDYAEVEKMLCMELINRGANAELLEGVPYREFLDMAVVYYVDYHDPEIGAGTIRVHNAHMEMWGVTEEDLWEAANINTPERKPGRVEDMEDVLAEMLAGYGSEDTGCSYGDMEKNPVPILVISNTQRVYGAAAILYSGVLKQAADKTGSDLFILPSSRHEVIAVPVTAWREAAELKEMVMEVNQKELQPEDVLSDNVYLYRREQDRLEIV